MILISQITGLWDDPRLIYAVAIAAVVLLAIKLMIRNRSSDAPKKVRPPKLMFGSNIGRRTIIGSINIRIANNPAVKNNRM